MRAQSGFSLLMLLGVCAITLILLAAAVPSWRYIMQDEREQELLFRGFQIADAVAAYQSKNGGGAPASLEVLVKGKYLRKAYKDPMTSDGAWRLIHPGETTSPITAPGAPGSPPSPSPLPALNPMGAPPGTTGFVLGVASRSREKSLRLFNGRSHYNEWIFAVGQPRVVGRTPELGVKQLFGGESLQASPAASIGAPQGPRRDPIGQRKENQS